jgi:hypothetical protein
VTNIGNRYHAHAGLFIASVAGVYVFHVTVFPLDDQRAAFEIMRDGHMICEVYTRNISGGGESLSGSSCMATTHLAPGDEVWVQNKYHDGGDAANARENTFSGFLLQAD